jgi:FkbM family methyltransferase
MKNILYRIIYHPLINWLVRNLSKPFGKLIGKPLVSVSGKLAVRANNSNFVLHTNQTCHVTQEIFFNGALNYEFTPFFLDLIKNCEVFIDVGANIGYFSILGAKVNPKLSVVAVEPAKGALHYLHLNRTENDLSNRISICEKAISDANTTLDFYVVNNLKYPWLTHTLNGSNSLQNQHGRVKNQVYPVEVITMKSLIEVYGIKKIDLLKLDTECTEHLILKSSVNEINTYRPIIICEVYESIREEITNVLNQFIDYELYQLMTDRLIPLKDFAHSKPNEYNYVFLPKEKFELISKSIT